jgi:hypothetical protein
MRRGRVAAAAITVSALTEATLVAPGRGYGSTRAERALTLPGDDIVADPSVVTDHAITIDAAPGYFWSWLVQMGWGRGGWYTPRWADQLLFPANGASAQRIHPDLQGLGVGDFIPDGPPHTQCGLDVEVLEPERALVLHSTSHLPLSWRDRAELDWSWAFVLTPLDDGQRTRYQFRSRWTTSPWWFTAGGCSGSCRPTSTCRVGCCSVYADARKRLPGSGAAALCRNSGRARSRRQPNGPSADAVTTRPCTGGSPAAGQRRGGHPG